MADIEAEADILKVGGAENLLQPVGLGNLVGDIFDQNRDSEGLGEYAQMFERSDGKFHLSRLPLLL